MELQPSLCCSAISLLQSLLLAIFFPLENVKEFTDQKTGADTKTEVLDLRND